MASHIPPFIDPGFGIYVHWPFCLSKCPYGDFNSHVRHKPVDEARYIAAFRSELAHRASLTKEMCIRDRGNRRICHAAARHPFAHAPGIDVG